MVRCDNCGWYNLDSSDTCEKCGEPLRRTEEQATALPEPRPAAKPMAQTEPKLNKKTVRFTPPRRNYLIINKLAIL